MLDPVVSVPLSTGQSVVLRCLLSLGATGGTDDEIEVLTSMPHASCSVRRRELVQLGFVVNSGRKRPTRTGTSAIVWIAQEEPNLILPKKVRHKPSKRSIVKALREIQSLMERAEASGYTPSIELRNLGIWLAAMTR